MTGQDPTWSLTDDALVLILHAEHDITAQAIGRRRPVGMRLGHLGGAAVDVQWQIETAVLRLVSTVEAYVNAVSEHFLTMKSQPMPKPPFTWPQRVDYYTTVHAIDLKACAGWDFVGAGISLRNCVAHGLGNLTDLLLHDKDLGKKVGAIDVLVSGNRMHCTPTTVPQLASGCRALVLDVERRLVAQL